MEDRIARTISNIASLDALEQFEVNARNRNALTDEIKATIRAKTIELGRELVSEKTRLDLSRLSPAEQKIVDTLGEFVAIRRRQGKTANRTFDQIRNRGLIGAAEAAVSRSKPTQGYEVLADADREDLSYERIILDHPDEFSPRAIWYSRRTLGLPNESDGPPKAAGAAPPASVNQDDEHGHGRNPRWSRDELILALELYLRFQDALPSQDSEEIAELSEFLGKLGRARGITQAETFRNANGVYMKLGNFRRLDPAYTSEGKVGLTRGNKEEESVWNDFSTDTEGLAKAVAEIRASIDGSLPAHINAQGVRVQPEEVPYWVFVCNPKKWAIDRFLDRRVERDTWGVRPSDRNRFAPGQLGIVRVGVDKRSNAQLDGKPPLEAGIYALCEIESEAFDGTGANDKFWAPGQAREPGWPTVKIRYLQTYLAKPLTIQRLRAEKPNISALLLNGFQAASFPIPADDFRDVVALLGEKLEQMPSAVQLSDVDAATLAAIEARYLNASPEVKQRISKTIERGPVGALVKQATGYHCQVCSALGRNPVGFLKKSGEPYVEAHHVTPVCKKEVGSLSASNIMTLCPNHHRQMHYGGVDVVIADTTFELTVDGQPIKILRLGLAIAAH
jgi:predicted HNH restriction endonuclease/predicted RNA-binding protein with PUA-like domain